MADVNYIGGLPVLIDNARYSHGNSYYNTATSDNDWFITGWFDTGSESTKKYTLYQPTLESGWTDIKFFNNKTSSSADYWSINHSSTNQANTRSFNSVGRYVACTIKKADAARSWCYCHTTGEWVFKGEHVDANLCMTESRRKIIANTPHAVTATGKMILFSTDVPASLKECKVTFKPVQSGSGTPGPNNIRNLSGFDGVDLFVSPSQNAADGTTYSISWPSQGTLYGGTVDMINGTLTQTHAYALYTGASTESWNVENSNNFYIMTPSTWLRRTNSATLFCNLAESYTGVSQGHCMITSSGNFNIHIGGIIDVHTVAGFKAYLTDHPLQVVCQLQTPMTYQLTGQTIKTLRGANNIWTGDDTDVTIKYWTHVEDAKVYDTIGGIPVYIDNAVYIGDSLLLNEYTTNADWFIIGPIDTGDTSTKSYTYSTYPKIVHSGYVALLSFDDLTKKNVDFWGEKNDALIRTNSMPGRYVVYSVYKSMADTSFMYDNTRGVYLFKGKNVT